MRFHGRRPNQSTPRRGLLLLEMLPELLFIAAFVGGTALVLSAAIGRTRSEGGSRSAASASRHEEVEDSNGGLLDSVYFVTPTPSGDFLVTTQSDSLLRITADGVESRSPKSARISRVIRAAASEHGSRVLLASEDGVVRLWNPSESDPAPTVIGRHTTHVAAVAVSRDGRQGATATSSGELRLWNLDDGALLQTLEAPDRQGWSGMQTLAFSLDGSELAAVQCSGLRFFRVPSGEMIREIPLDAENHAPTAVQISPDGRWVVAGTASGDLVLRDASTLETLWSVADAGQPVLALEFSHDSRTLLAGSLSGELRMFDARTGELKDSVGAHARGLRCIRMLPVVNVFLTAGYDGHIRRWDLGTFTETGSLR